MPILNKHDGWIRLYFWTRCNRAEEHHVEDHRVEEEERRVEDTARPEIKYLFWESYPGIWFLTKQLWHVWEARLGNLWPDSFQGHKRSLNFRNST